MEHARFSVNPGSVVLVAGNYSVKAVQTQVTLRGTAGRETWLGVDLLRGGGGHGGGGKATGWMQSSELQRSTARGNHWKARLRGRGREGWSGEDHSWACEGPVVTGHG